MKYRNGHRDELNYQLQLAEAELALDMALTEAQQPIVSSKFGPDSAVFLHLITQRIPDIAVVHVQTGYESRATRAFTDQLADQLGLNLHIFKPEGHVITIPPTLDDPEHAAFTAAVKLEPFQRAVESLDPDVWLSSIRRYQSAHRQSEPVFRSLPSGVLKVSPILGWTSDTVARYARKHDLPTGPDAFDPTKGEPFRECGLHLAASA